MPDSADFLVQFESVQKSYDGEILVASCSADISSEKNATTSGASTTAPSGPVARRFDVAAL